MGTAVLPVDLLAQRGLGPQAKLLYGVLQLTPGFRNRSGQFTYAQISSLAGLCRDTVRRAVSGLAGAGWIQISQRHQLAPVEFTLGMPAPGRGRSELIRARLRLAREASRGTSRGEALMQEYLSLLIDSPDFEENARPGFLVNPTTGECMELDRYYPQLGVALEYNGPQHYSETDRFPDEEAARQQRGRDLIKQGICMIKGIRLVVIHRDELSLPCLKQKLAGLVPLRDLNGHGLLVDYLEAAAWSYRGEGLTQKRLPG